MIHDGPVLGTGNGATVIDCQACGYAHLDPLPSIDEITALYEDQYYQVHNAGFTHKAHVSHFDEQGEDLTWHEIAFREQLDMIEKTAPNCNMLDYGAGAGWFAQYVRGASWSNWSTDKPRWSVTAVEPSGEARLYAENIVKTHVVEKLPDKEQWGIIRASYVLEHLVDPCQALLDLRERLSDNGILCILVPNEFNAWACRGRDKFDLDSYWIRPGLHLNYFTHNSVARLLQRSGFEVIDQLATFPTELFMIGGIDFASDPNLGHRLHHARMNIELAIDSAGFGNAKLGVYRELANAGLGRASVVYARKRAGATQ